MLPGVREQIVHELFTGTNRLLDSSSLHSPEPRPLGHNDSADTDVDFGDLAVVTLSLLFEIAQPVR